MIDPVTGAAIISAGTSLAGGLLGRDSAEKAARQSYKHQKEFAQNSVAWRVADAARSGINPYFALGAPTMSFSDTTGVDPLPGAIADMGQDVGRAMLANSPTRQTAIDKAQLAYTQAQTDLTRAKTASELRLATQNSLPPGVKLADRLPIADIDMKVAQPGYGQRQEDNYGDFGGGLLGLMALLRDSANTFGGAPTLATTKKELSAIFDAYTRMSGPWPPAASVRTQDLPGYLY